MSERAIRDFIKRHARVKGCTSLPVGAFKSFGGSNARTAILHLEKGAADGKRRFLAQAEFVGYDIASKYYREIERNDLAAIVDGYDELKAQLA
jgi:type I restriction enzyme M protein